MADESFIPVPVMTPEPTEPMQDAIPVTNASADDPLSMIPGLSHPSPQATSTGPHNNQPNPSRNSETVAQDASAPLPVSEIEASSEKATSPKSKMNELSTVQQAEVSVTSLEAELPDEEENTPKVTLGEAMEIVPEESKIAGDADDAASSDDRFDLHTLKSILPRYKHDPESTPSPQPKAAIPLTPTTRILQDLQATYSVAMLREQLTLLLLSTFPTEVSLEEIVTNVTSGLSNAQMSIMTSPASPGSQRMVNPSSEKDLVKFCLSLAEVAQQTAAGVAPEGGFGGGGLPELDATTTLQKRRRRTGAAAKKQARVADQGDSENEGSTTVDSSDESPSPPPRKRRKTSTSKKSKKKTAGPGTRMAVRVAPNAREQIKFQEVKLWHLTLRFARLWERHPSSFMGVIQAHRQLLDQPLPEYSLVHSNEERESALMTMLQLLAGHTAERWFSELQNRFYLIIFNTWMQKEAEYRIKTCAEWKDHGVPQAKMLLLEQLEHRLPLGLKSFMKAVEDNTQKARIQVARGRLLKNMERWTVIQQKIGWIGVVLGGCYDMDILYSGSDDRFSNMVQILVNERHTMACILQQGWPGFPQLLLNVGGDSDIFIPAITQFIKPSRDQDDVDHTSEDEDDEEEPGVVRDDEIENLSPALDQPENLNDSEDINAPSPPSPHPENEIIPDQLPQPQSQELIMSDIPPSDDNQLTQPQVEAHIDFTELDSVTSNAPSMSNIPPSQNNPPPPSKLSFCRWNQNSCSLDASLVITILIMESLPRYYAGHEASGSLALQVFYRHHVQWRSTSWEDRSIDTLTAARNAVRNALRASNPPLHITKSCSVDQTLRLLIPSTLRTTKVEGMFSCSNLACVQRNDEPGWQPKEKTSHCVKPYSLETIFYDAQRQRETSVQHLLDDLVLLLYSLLNTSLQPALFQIAMNNPPACKACRRRNKVSLTDIRIVTPPPVLMLHPNFPNENIYAGSAHSITYPFVHDLQVTFANKQYTYVGSVMTWTDHFWTVINVNSEIYLGESIIKDPHLIYHGPGPFVSQKKQGSHLVQPDYHIYRLSEDLEDPVMTNIAMPGTKEGDDPGTEKDSDIIMEI